MLSLHQVHGIQAEGSSFEIPRQHTATPVESSYSLQSHAVEARFREQVNAEVAATVNGLQPTVRRLLEQAPTTIRDTVDSDFANWPDFDVSAANQSYYLSGLQPSHAHIPGPSETLSSPAATQNSSQLRNLNVNLFAQSDTGLWRNGTNPPSFDSAYGEGINDPCLNSFSNPLGDAANNTEMFTLHDPSYIDNRIQTQVRAEIAPLTQQIGDLRGLLRQALQQATVAPSHADGQTSERNPDSDRRLLSESQHGSNDANPSSQQSGGSNGSEPVNTTAGPDHLGELSSVFDM